MERSPVQSSNIASVGFDLTASILEVEFVKGGIYQYSGVPEYIYQEFMSSGSKGQYFDQNIKKGSYPFAKVG